eukprot:2954060-Amphidinium_carterae.1
MKATKLQKERCPSQNPAVPGPCFSDVREKQGMWSPPRNGPQRPQTHVFCSSDKLWDGQVGLEDPCVLIPAVAGPFFQVSGQNK